MNLDHTPEQMKFRDELRAWAEIHVPADEPPFDNDADRRAYDTGWQRAQWEGGWAGISWPVEDGGRGASLTEQVIFHEEMARARAPEIGCCFVAINHAGPTIMAAGTPEQRAKHLPAILRGDEVWCQGFSEPGAGSDLAAIATRGRVEGDHLVVTGQKTWTSFANLADYCELLVRTGDPDSRYAGLTWAILDMRSPGIDVRPIRTILGQHHFCEVFLDDVRIPLSDVVGEVNGGWKTAMTTLGFERGVSFMARQVRLRQKIDDLAALLSEPGVDPGWLHRLPELRARADALRAMCYRLAGLAEAGAPPGPEGSLLRIYFSELTVDVARLALDVLGPDVFTATDWNLEYYGALRDQISAGTIDIQRNIVGERLLGLPKGG